VVVKEIDWEVPVSRTLPFASSDGRSSCPMTELPETENWASPLSLVICVPAGNWSVEASEPRWRTGFVTGEPNCSV
jgi:hypothetical protein